VDAREAHGAARTTSEDDRVVVDGVGQALGHIRGGQELRLAYDGLGRRRLERRGKTGTADTDVVLEYDGPNVIQETAAATGAIQFSTMHAPAIDAPMATWFGQLTPTTTTYDLGTNARGDVTIVAKAGSLSEEQLLDPYGEREAKVGTAATCVEGKEAGTASLPMQTCTTLTILQRFGIGGARQHPATKLVDLRNRVYATHLRGFLTKDPMGSVDSDGLYNYVAGDPVNLRDPWGLSATEADDIGPSRETVVRRQRCDAECKADKAEAQAREVAALGGINITDRDQSRVDRKVPSSAPSSPRPSQPTAPGSPRPDSQGEIFPTPPGIEWPITGVFGDLGFGRRLEYDDTWRVTFPAILRPEGIPIDIATGLAAGALAGKIGGFLCRGACPTTPLFKWLFDRSCFVAGTPVFGPGTWCSLAKRNQGSGAGSLLSARL
jgi:RHS repeat-associated protein